MLFKALLALVFLSVHASGDGKKRVHKAFEHPTGFILFELISEKRLKDLQEAERTPDTTGAMSQQEEWYFGMKDEGTFTRLLPFFHAFSIGDYRLTINLPFFSRRSLDGMTMGKLIGEVVHDKYDPLAPRKGQVEIRCSAGQSACLQFNDDLVSQLDRRLQAGQLVLQDQNRRFRNIEGFFADPSGVFYIVDAEKRIQTQLVDTQLKEETVEVIRVHPNGDQEFLPIRSYGESQPSPADSPIPRTEALAQLIEFANGDRLEIASGKGPDRSVYFEGGKPIPLMKIPPKPDLLKKLGMEPRYRQHFASPCDFALLLGKQE